MQGIYGRGYSDLCLVLNNAADECLRLARWVKINEKRCFWVFLMTGIMVFC
jgi:hypothetical protein